jgi:hypothetical protein
MKRQWTVVGIALYIFSWTASVQAQAIRAIPASQARGETQIVTVDLYRGYGVTLNFRPINETIRRAWLDNPSQVTLDFDDSRCAVLGESRECAATVIHLRRINPLNFPGLPSAGTTALTVLTDTGIYKFQLSFPGSGTPSYYTLAIQPDRGSPRPSLTSSTRQSGVPLVEQGLRIAQIRNLISERDPLWSRLQTFLQLVRQGVPVSEATRRAGVSQSLIVRLTEMGQGTAEPARF